MNRNVHENNHSNILLTDECRATLADQMDEKGWLTLGVKGQSLRRQQGIHVLCRHCWNMIVGQCKIADALK